MKKIVFTALIAAVIVLPGSAQAKSIWSILFPYFTPQEKPVDETLRAPFAAPETENAPRNELTALYDEAQLKLKSLDQPHRSSDEIGRWLINAISEIMSIDADVYQDHLKHLSTGMNENAMSGFSTFVAQGNIISVLSSGGMKLTGFADGAPVLLNEGAVDGRYRWLFDVPVTISYIPKNQKKYSGTIPQAQKVGVTVQVGRVPKGQGSDEMMIETFDLKARP